MQGLISFIIGIVAIWVVIICAVLISPQFWESWTMHKGYHKRMNGMFEEVDNE